MDAQDTTTYGFNKPDSLDLLQLIGNDDGEYSEGRVRGRQQPIAAFVTPGGGIAARSGATLGSATCTLLTLAGGTRATTSAAYTVYNDFLSAVSGSVDVMAARVNGIWVVIAEDCT